MSRGQVTGMPRESTDSMMMGSESLQGLWSWGCGLWACEAPRGAAYARTHACTPEIVSDPPQTHHVQNDLATPKPLWWGVRYRTPHQCPAGNPENCAGTSRVTSCVMYLRRFLGVRLPGCLCVAKTTPERPAAYAADIGRATNKHANPTSACMTAGAAPVRGPRRTGPARRRRRSTACLGVCLRVCVGWAVGRSGSTARAACSSRAASLGTTTSIQHLRRTPKPRPACTSSPQHQTTHPPPANRLCILRAAFSGSCGVVPCMAVQTFSVLQR